MWNDLGTEGDLSSLCEDSKLKSREYVVVLPVLLRKPESKLDFLFLVRSENEEQHRHKCAKSKL